MECDSFGGINRLAVRTALTALIAFMPTDPNGALGALDYKKEERRVLAAKSREAAPKFGSPDRQKLIDEIHEYMISKAALAPQPDSLESSKPPTSDTEQSSEALLSPENTNTEIINPEEQQHEEQHEASSNENTEAESSQSRIAAQVSPVAPSATLNVPSPVTAVVEQHQPMVQKPADDRLLTWAAVGLALAIDVLLLKKFMKSSGHGAMFMGES